MKKGVSNTNLLIAVLAIAVVFFFLVVFVFVPVTHSMLNVYNEVSFSCSLGESTHLHPIERPPDGDPCDDDCNDGLDPCNDCCDSHTYLFGENWTISTMSVYIYNKCGNVDYPVKLYFLKAGEWAHMYDFDVSVVNKFDLSFELTQIEGFRFEYHECCLYTKGEIKILRETGGVTPPPYPPSVSNWFPWWIIALMIVFVAVVAAVGIKKLRDE